MFIAPYKPPLIFIRRPFLSKVIILPNISSEKTASSNSEKLSPLVNNIVLPLFIYFFINRWAVILFPRRQTIISLTETRPISTGSIKMISPLLKRGYILLPTIGMRTLFPLLSISLLKFRESIFLCSATPASHKIQHTLIRNKTQFITGNLLG